MKRFLRGMHDAGPYALLALLVPGGSLIALVIWLVRRYSAAPAPGQILRS